MPELFDPNDPKGLEAPTLYCLADRLSECLQFIELSESADIAEARTKITIGPIPEPLGGESYTKEELKNDHFWCRISPEDNEGHETARPETITELPLEGGRIEIYFRRQVRDAELAATGGKTDVYLYFLDRISAIASQVKVAARGKGDLPRLGSVTREFSPSFGDIASAASQGEYIWSSLIVEWGDLDLGSGR